MRYRFFLALALLVCFATACELQEAPYSDDYIVSTKEDYREPYCGLFRFTSRGWLHSMGNYSYGAIDTFLGTVSPLEDSDSLLRIHYYHESANYDCDNSYYVCVKPKLRTDGILVDPTFMATMSHPNFSGAYSKRDSLDVNWGMGGNGFQAGRLIHGVRVK